MEKPIQELRYLNGRVYDNKIISLIGECRRVKDKIILEKNKS